IVARSGANTDPAPFAQRRFEPPLDLRGTEELRLWLRSNRPGDGGTGHPFYLAFEASSKTPAPTLSWGRLLPVKKRETWEPPLTTSLQPPWNPFRMSTPRCWQG